MFPTPHQHTAPSRRGGATLTSALVFLAFLTLLASATVGASEPAPSPPITPPTAEDVPPADVVQLADLPLAVDESPKDLGLLIKGQVVHHTFTLTNSGSEAIAFERASSGPGCKVVEFDRSVAPGGQARIEVALDSSTITGKASCVTGLFAAGVEDPAALLVLQVRVEPRLLAHPGYARWIYVQHEEEGKIRQTVYSTDGSEFDVVAVRSPMEAISTSFRRATEEERREDHPGSQWIVETILDPQAPTGPIRGRLAVETTHAQQKILEIPLSGFVRPALFVQPPAGRFGTLELTEPRPALFDVRNFATDPIHLKEVSTDIAGTAARILPVEAGRRYRIEVSFDPAAMEAGPFRGTLHIATDSEAVPTLEVPLSGNLTRPTAAEAGTD